MMLDRPQVWGVPADTVVIRVTARTAPQGRLKVFRELRERLKDALDRGADPVPQRTDPVGTDLAPQQADPPQA